MRVVTFGVANSLDNFIARSDHGTDWLAWTDEIAEISATYWKTVDTVLMGRKTYEVALKAGITSYAGAKNYVFSRAFEAPPGADVEVVRADAVDFVRALKQQPGAGICAMGGGELAHALFEADLIDQVGVNIQPVLLGAGVPLFLASSRQRDLELIEHKVLQTGSIYLLYRLKR